MREHGADSHITLRALEPEDLDFLYSIENNQDLWESGCATMPYSRFALNNYILGSTCDIYADKQMRLLIEDSQGEAVGLVDLFNFEPKHLRAEVGIVIASNSRHLGYGYDALRQLADYSRHTLHLHQLYAVVDVENSYSRRLFESAGYADMALLKDWLLKDKQYGDAMMMQIFL